MKKIYKSKIKFFGKIDNPNLKQGSPKLLKEFNLKASQNISLVINI